MDPQAPVGSVPLVGPRFARALKKLNIQTVGDLIYHTPHRYQNYSLISKINRVQLGETVTIQGEIVSIKNLYTRGGKVIQKAVVSDGEGQIEVTWFNQPFLVKNLPAGTKVSLSGKVDAYGTRPALVSPEYEKIGNTQEAIRNTVHTGRLVPVYPETYGLSSKWLRSRIANILPQVVQSIEEPLPQYITTKYRLLPLSQALRQIHFPQDSAEADEARRRLAFDELLAIQLRAAVRKNNWKKKLARKLAIDQEKVMQFVNSLPFQLTLSQKRSIREILSDLAGGEPMNRLLAGDVGSGKTVVAALGCLAAHNNGFQSAIMAPTQILALQHFNTLNSILGPLGISIKLITSGTKKTKLASQGDALRDQNAHVIIGTHALLQKSISFDKLGLVVIDEQHRFGVTQRALLTQKGQASEAGEFAPHVLTMTATPIPRTVALTLYGDLDLSTLDEMPAGRIKIKTWVVPPQKREAAYGWIRNRVKNTAEQAFIVCPLIEQSEKETMQSVKAATAEFQRLSKEIFPDLNLGLLHGKVKAAEKEEIMDKTRSGGLDILVATPVVEVGIDIPNATIMMVEAAERFGLAQLHQLRGRVGRSNLQSYCLLFSETTSPRALSRLAAMEKSLSGAELAEIDLKLRGPGEIYGTAQHGFPQLRVASFSDVELIHRTRETAEWLMTNHQDVSKIIRESATIAPN